MSSDWNSALVNTEGIQSAALPQLRDLTLLIPHSYPLLDLILNHIDAPRLEELALEGDGYTVEEPLSQAMTGFLFVISPSTTKFISMGTLLHHHTLAHVCQMLPNLASLTVYDHINSDEDDPDDYFVPWLYFDFSPNGRLQNGQNTRLEHLALDPSDLGQMDLDVGEYYAQVVQAVSSRLRLPSPAIAFDGEEVKPLKTLRLSSVDRETLIVRAPEVYAALLGFREDGLELIWESF